jgi:Flp pilus assembly protein TadB
MSESKTTTSGGIGFIGLLTIAFIILKLCNVVQWSWWWVLSPIWITAALVLTIVLTCFLILSKHNKNESKKYKKRLEELINKHNNK